MTWRTTKGAGENLRELFSLHAGQAKLTGFAFGYPYRPHTIPKGKRAANEYAADVSTWGPWRAGKYSSGKIRDPYREELRKPWFACRYSSRAEITVKTHQDGSRSTSLQPTSLALKRAGLPKQLAPKLTTVGQAYAWHLLLMLRGFGGPNER